MRAGDQVVWLPYPWIHGIGTITHTGKHGWLWVTYQDGHVDQYDPHTLELADTWERKQADRLDPAMFTEAR